MGFFGVTGWPNLTLTPTGGFMGMGTNTGKQVDMRGRISFLKKDAFFGSTLEYLLYDRGR